MTGYFIAKHDENNNHSVFVQELNNRYETFIKLDDLEDDKYQLITFTNYNIACNYATYLMTHNRIKTEDYSKILVINCEELINKGE